MPQEKQSVYNWSLIPDIQNEVIPVKPMGWSLNFYKVATKTFLYSLYWRSVGG